MTAKEVASRVHHCSNKVTTERVIQAAMDEARNAALEEAATKLMEGVEICSSPTIIAQAQVSADYIRALKTGAKPPAQPDQIVHGVNCPKGTHPFKSSPWKRDVLCCYECGKFRDNPIHSADRQAEGSAGEGERR